MEVRDIHLEHINYTVKCTCENIFILLGLILKIYRSQCMDLRTAVMRAQCFVTVKSASSVL